MLILCCKAVLDKLWITAQSNWSRNQNNRMNSDRENITTVSISEFGTIRLSYAQLCAEAIAGWDQDRQALALINLHGVERASGLDVGCDSSLDCSQWLSRAVGLQVSCLFGRSMQRRRMIALGWPWLEFDGGAVQLEFGANSGKREQLPWSAISALWITPEPATANV